MRVFLSQVTTERLKEQINKKRKEKHERDSDHTQAHTFIMRKNDSMI